ncbi:hypothetical protein GGR52DRAFT_573713 [Hypoxylon sp. FL1284]|nr:hypothetical protein GGR52DRAFT_573713 [Hypoxylon sp. FL1284]
MAPPTMETQINVVSAAAQIFIEQYYEALQQKPRRPLAPFYASASPRLASAAGGGATPDLSINGRACGSVAEFEALLDAQAPGACPVVYDVRSYDAHPVSAVYGVGGEPEGGKTTGPPNPEKGDLVSFALQVSGVVRIGRGHVSRGDDQDGAGDAAAPATNGAAGAGVGSGAAGNIFASGEKKDDENPGPVEKQFNEAFLMVPHWEAWSRNAPRNVRKWLIVSQNYRTF